MKFTDQIRQFAVSSQSKAAKAVEGVRVAVSESVINKILGDQCIRTYDKV